MQCEVIQLFNRSRFKSVACDTTVATAVVSTDGATKEVERKAGDEEAGGGGEDLQMPVLRPRQGGRVQDGACEAQASDADVPRVRRELSSPHQLCVRAAPALLHASSRGRFARRTAHRRPRVRVRSALPHTPTPPPPPPRPDLSEPIDVYCDWIDSLEDLKQTRLAEEREAEAESAYADEAVVAADELAEESDDGDAAAAAPAAAAPAAAAPVSFGQGARGDDHDALFGDDA